MQVAESGKCQLKSRKFFEKPAAVPYHKKILNSLVTKINALLSDSYRELYFSSINMVFDSHIVLQTDLVYIVKERLHIVGLKNIAAAPGFVVNILS